MDDAAIHRVSRDAVDLSLRFPFPSGSPRAYNPRGENIWSDSVYGSRTTHTMSLRGKNEVTDAAIHCMQSTVRTMHYDY